MAVSLSLLEVPVRPSPDEARRWLTEELSKRGYERDTTWFEQWIQRLLDRLVIQGLPEPSANFPTTLAVVIVMLVLAGLVWFVWRARPEARHRRAESATSALLDPTLTADDHRAKAAELLAAGAYDLAVISAFRAIVADMVRRTVLGARPGDTAQEVARSVAQVFPDHRGDVHRAADLFDQAAYRQESDPSGAPTTGPAHSSATAEDVHFIQGLDARLRAARPHHTQAQSHPPHAVGSRR